jgi:hypothetical protein
VRDRYFHLFPEFLPTGDIKVNCICIQGKLNQKNQWHELAFLLVLLYLRTTKHKMHCSTCMAPTIWLLFCHNNHNIVHWCSYLVYVKRRIGFWKIIQNSFSFRVTRLYYTTFTFFVVCLQQAFILYKTLISKCYF